MPKYNDEERTLDLPENTSLPFFAYGIFKPGQLAYSKIRNHISETTDTEINYGMLLRDGVPILTGHESNYRKTKGTLITFRRGHEQKTYEIICKTLLRKLYEWKTIEVNGTLANVVFGVNPNNGSYSIEDNYERENFDGKNDSFFKEGLELIEKNLNSNKFSWNLENFFELQMNYMFLWSAIDRYSSLKYNKKKKKWNNQRFANEKAFKEGIKRFEGNHHRPVYSTEDLTIHEFNAEEPYETLKYYYTLRCNVVHKGKSQAGDYDMLKTAAMELLEIFKNIIEDTFN